MPCASVIACWNSLSFWRSRKSISYLPVSSIAIERSDRRRTRTAKRPSCSGFIVASSLTVSNAFCEASVALDTAVSPSVRSFGARAPANRARLSTLLSIPSNSEVSSFCSCAGIVVSTSW